MALRENWYELPVDDQESIDLDSGKLTAKRKFRGPWNDRFQFLAGFIPTINGGPTGASFDYDLYTYPDMPTCVVTGATISGKLVPNKLGADEQISYDKVEIIVNYASDNTNFFLTSGINGDGGTPPAQDDVPVTQTSYSIKSVTEMIKFDGKNVKRKDGIAQHDKRDFNMTIKYTDIEITYHNTTSPSLVSCLANQGKINADALVLGDIDIYLPAFDARTLRYDGIVGETKVQIRSMTNKRLALTWSVTHKLRHNRLRWDRIPIGCEPQRVNQANAFPINIIFEDICLYELSNDDFGFLRRKNLA